MNNETAGLIAILIVTILFALPLARYMGKIYLGESHWSDYVFGPLERLIFRLSGIDAGRGMNWKQHLKALLAINLVWFILSMLVLMNMGWLPLNPDGNPSMNAALAFNTTASFVTNTNLQHYAGETGLSYLGQLTLMVWQFISAGTGMAACVALFMSMREGSAGSLGNFYNYLVKSCTRILFPLALLLALLMVFSGTPMTLAGKATYTSLEGDTIQVSRGPAAAMIAIKQLGTNGGGYFGANSAHPLENPDYFTNMLENISILLIPIALLFTMGYILKKKKFSLLIMGVMTAGFFILLALSVYSERKGNPLVSGMGISQARGNMEGKEIRFGAAASALWAVSTTCTSNGSVNSMHDSLMPLSGMSCLLGMLVNAFYGGVGVGFLNFYVFIIIGVFISGLMVGRTPEFLGRKIEAREMKIASIIVLLHPFLILAGTALASYLFSRHTAQLSSWLGNPGFHGFSEMLYEYTSAAANNGSGMEGLGDNTNFWNIGCGLVILLGRYLPIIGPLAIAGSLAEKKYIPPSAGTLRVDTLTFGVMLFGVILIVAALSFFPALTLGPLSEWLQMQ